MLENKVLINLFVLSQGKHYEIYIPVNEKIGNISKLLNANLFDSIDEGKNCMLFNIETGNTYMNNDLIKNTDIKNGTKILLV